MTPNAYPSLIKYAVIGWPLGHSMSPLIHNASFAARGLDCRLEARAVSPSQFEQFMNSAAREYHGIAVTLPYKTEVLRFCKEQDERVVFIGAANTLWRMPNGEWQSYNTDAVAVSHSLRTADVEPRDKSVVVLGAGGAARAVCFQILLEGAARLTIANRTISRSESLKRDMINYFRGGVALETIDLSEGSLRIAISGADILINTTSIGMYPHTDESPVPPGLLKKELAVFDVVYNPMETRLLREARAAGARAIPGTEMLLYQAAEQERIWLGEEAEVDVPVMRAALLKELGRSL